VDISFQKARPIAEMVNAISQKPTGDCSAPLAIEIVQNGASQVYGKEPVADAMLGSSHVLKLRAVGGQGPYTWSWVSKVTGSEHCHAKPAYGETKKEEIYTVPDEQGKCPSVMDTLESTSNDTWVPEGNGLNFMTKIVAGGIKVHVGEMKKPITETGDLTIGGRLRYDGLNGGPLPVGDFLQRQGKTEDGEHSDIIQEKPVEVFTVSVTDKCSSPRTVSRDLRVNLEYPDDPLKSVQVLMFHKGMDLKYDTKTSLTMFFREQPGDPTMPTMNEERIVQQRDAYLLNLKDDSEGWSTFQLPDIEQTSTLLSEQDGWAESMLKRGLQMLLPSSGSAGSAGLWSVEAGTEVDGGSDPGVKKLKEIVLVWRESAEYPSSIDDPSWFDIEKLFFVSPGWIAAYEDGVDGSPKLFNKKTNGKGMSVQRITNRQVFLGMDEPADNNNTSPVFSRRAFPLYDAL
jgi:hypothetical protein